MHHGAQSAPYDIFNFTMEMELGFWEQAVWMQKPN